MRQSASEAERTGRQVRLHAQSRPSADQAERSRGAANATPWLIAAGVVAALVLPVGCVIAVWWLGPKLNHAALPFLTPLLFVILLVGLPATLAVLFRWLFRVEARLAARAGREAALRVRRSHSRGIRARRRVLELDPLPDLGAVRKTAAAAVVLVMFAGALAVCVGGPLLSLWLVSQIARSTAPAMGAYALVAVGIAATMALGVYLLALLQRAYQRLTRSREVRRSAGPVWLRSYSDDAAVRPARRGLEEAMVAAVILVAVALVVWFFALAEPSSVLQRALRGA